jgi:hypothetical protein
MVDPDGLAPFVLIIVGVAKGSAIVYRVYKTYSAAQKAAQLLNKAGKVVEHAGHKGGPAHFHNTLKPYIHITRRGAAEGAKQRGATGWRNYKWEKIRNDPRF